MGKFLLNATAVECAEIGLDSSARDFVEGKSPNMRPVEAAIRELANSDVPVLLLAEAGAGKRSTARRIHEMSWRKEQPFQWVECSTLMRQDLETIQRSGGLARPGTLYLNEVADLSLECQAYVQQSWPQSGNGTNGSRNVRLICGSARDLETEVRAKRMREDLYYRISGICLRLPPLRQRKEDIPALMRHFLNRYGREFRREIPNLSAETHRLFQEYSWPRNIEELKYACSVLVALGDEEIAMGGLRALLHRSDSKNGADAVSLKAASRAASQEAEKDLILKALTRTRWNRRRAALELQISYKAFLYKLKRIQVEGYGVS